MHIFIAPTVLWCISAIFLGLSLFDHNVPSQYWWFATASCMLLSVIVTYRATHHEARKLDRQQRCKSALKTLQHELRNFEQIIDAQASGRTFSGLHQKAVEVYSFENAAEALGTIKNLWKYRKLSKAAKHEIEMNQKRSLGEMQIQKLLALLTTLVSKLEQECDEIPGS